MTSSKTKAGTEILIECARCKLKLWHIVLALVNGQPVRVKCTTCKGERNYKAPSVKQILSSPRKTATPLSETKPYFQKLQTLSHKEVRTYKATEAFEVDDVILHPTFGKGVVLKLMHPDRMQVMFSGEVKVLARKS